MTLIAGEEPGEAANPHLWMDVAYASAYAERIADALTAVDPDDAATYRANLDDLPGAAARRSTRTRGPSSAAIPEASRTVSRSTTPSRTSPRPTA